MATGVGVRRLSPAPVGERLSGQCRPVRAINIGGYDMNDKSPFFPILFIVATLICHFIAKMDVLPHFA